MLNGPPALATARFGACVTWNRLASAACSVLLTSVLAIGCFPSDEEMCSIAILAARPSPTGDWRAVAFTRDCGALSDEVTSVSILSRDAGLPNDYGNVLRYVDTTSIGPTVPRAALSKPLIVEWTPEGKLIVTLDRRADVNHKVVLYKTIPVEYREYE